MVISGLFQHTFIYFMCCGLLIGLAGESATAGEGVDKMFIMACEKGPAGIVQEFCEKMILILIRGSVIPQRKKAYSVFFRQSNGSELMLWKS